MLRPCSSLDYLRMYGIEGSFLIDPGLLTRRRRVRDEGLDECGAVRGRR
jgi:hypothetical protein